MIKAHGIFQDKVAWNGVEKTAISVRDGVIEYLGREIGMKPDDKMFRVYRSPATIANAAMNMVGIKVTNDHVDVDMPVSQSDGEVLSAKMIDLNQPDTQCRVGILNTLRLDGDLPVYLDAGKRELSLGYRGSLIDAPIDSNFDLEQIDIIPHHLAVVDAGRCGSVCSFIDHKPNEGNENMTKLKHKAFLDAEGNPSLTEIVAIAQELPNAIKTIPVDQLAKILPTLQEIIKSAGAAGAAPTDVPPAEGEEVMDAAPTDVPPAEGEEVMDADPKADPVKKEIAVTDSKEFKDSVKAAVGQYATVVEKARKFLPENYSFADKATDQIMRDALAVEHGKQKFADNELEIAFKMLKPRKSDYKSFGDNAAQGKFTALANKEI